MSLELIQSPLFNDASLKAYYRLQNPNDSKGSNHLTNNNAVGFSAAQFNDGANFGPSNTNKSLNVLNNLGIDGGVCSLSIWVKLLAEITTGIFGFVDLVSSNADVGNRIRYYYNSGSPLVQFHRVKHNVGEQGGSYGVSLGTSNWHHMVYTYDGTYVRGYINGSLVVGPIAASGTGSGAPSYLVIGASSTSNESYIPANFASALIDDVAIFNRVLSATEVSDLYIGTAFQGAMI